METNKYYTPETNEFFIGFDCEYYSNHAEKFIPITIDSSNFELNSMDGSFDDDYVLSGNYSNPNKFRVKYLDKSDIESLGFSIKVETKFGITFSNQLYSIIISKMKKNHIEIYLTQPYIKEDNGLKFSGIIKNKSELVKLLKQLEINAQYS